MTTLTPLMRPAIAFLSIAAVTACGPEIDHIDPYPRIIEVEGRVTTVSGSPVPGASVTVKTAEGVDCPSEMFAAAPDDTTDTAGKYLVTIELGAFGVVCVRVVAQPPSDAGLLPDSAQRAGIEPPLATLTVDIALEAGGSLTSLVER